MASTTRVTVWNEYRHEQNDSEVAAIYPNGIHTVIATALNDAGFQVSTATLDEPEHGLAAPILDATDVLIWWGHMAYGVGCPAFRAFLEDIQEVDGYDV